MLDIYELEISNNKLKDDFKKIEFKAIFSI